jgi:curli biogenesis system outer membrane secretion channel CsgG
VVEETTPALRTHGPKKRVAVVDFVNKSDFGADRLGKGAADILTTELVKSDRFIVVERAKLEKLLDEQGLALSGVVDEATAAKTGRILGLNAILTGAISQFGTKIEGQNLGVYRSKKQTAECVVDIRVIDASTGEILLAESGMGKVDVGSEQFLGLGSQKGFDETLPGKALRAAVTQLMDGIVGQLESVEWRGKIASIQGDKIYVNAGKETGLQIGDRLRVRGKGEEIVDPDTGIAIGESLGREKGMIEVKEYFGADGAIAQIVSGSGFSRGDAVQRTENNT